MKMGIPNLTYWIKALLAIPLFWSLATDSNETESELSLYPPYMSLLLSS